MKKELILGSTVIQEAAYLAKEWEQKERGRTVYRERLGGDRNWRGQSYLNLDQRYQYTMSRPMEEFEEADLICVVGSHLRKETALLNARIRKTLKQKECEVLWMGSPEDLNYPVTWSGLTPQNWKQVVEGRHPWCEKIQNATKPWLLIGASVWESGNGKTLGLDWIQKNNPHLELGYLHAGANSVGLLEAGIEATYNPFGSGTRKEKENVRFWMLPDFSEKDRCSPFYETSSKKEIVLTPHVDSSLPERKNQTQVLYWPATVWCEKEGTWKNLEGRAQKLKASVKPSFQSKDEWTLLGTWLMYLKEKWVRPKKEMFQDFSKKNPDSFASDSSWLRRLSFGSTGTFWTAYERPVWSGAPFRSWLDTFYQTDTLTSHSKILASCTRTLERCPPGSEKKTTGGAFFPSK